MNEQPSSKDLVEAHRAHAQEVSKLQSENARLRKCLAEANAGFEKYERLYYLEKMKNEEAPDNEPCALLDREAERLKREIASDLYSRAAAVIRAYADDAGDDHSVGICNCSDIRLADELDAAGAGQAPCALPEGFASITDRKLAELLDEVESNTLRSALIELQMRRAGQPPLDTDIQKSTVSEVGGYLSPGSVLSHPAAAALFDSHKVWMKSGNVQSRDVTTVLDAVVKLIRESEHGPTKCAATGEQS